MNVGLLKGFTVKIYTLFLALILGVFIVNIQAASAVKYTTRDKPSQKKSAPIAGQRNKPKDVKKAPKCTARDIQHIKRFDVTARKKKQEFDDLMENKDTITTQKQAAKFSKEYKKISGFYQSDEFKAMRVVYTRCGKAVPVSKTNQLFWIYGSEDKEISIF